MDDFKFEIFKNENPNTPLFKVFQLPSNKVQRIQQELFRSLKIEGENIRELERRLYDEAKVIVQSIPETNFSMHDIFRSIQVDSEFIYVTWDSFVNIDKFRLPDFCRWFEYIWYPSSDDIDIFNDDLTWILHVYHYETIALTCLKK